MQIDLSTPGVTHDKANCIAVPITTSKLATDCSIGRLTKNEIKAPMKLLPFRAMPELRAESLVGIS
jgi:hypothetical protein